MFSKLKPALAAAVLCCMLAPAASATTSPTWTLGQLVNGRITASSTGAPCYADCWELWQFNNVGSVMVEKGSDGQIINAGRWTDPYFADLYASADEAVRNLPSKGNYYVSGSVAYISRENSSCATSCTLLLDFSGTGKLLFTRNADGVLYISLNATGVGGINYVEAGDELDWDSCGIGYHVFGGSCVEVSSGVYGPGYGDRSGQNYTSYHFMYSGRSVRVVTIVNGHCDYDSWGQNCEGI
jgi:hypothetical protein